MKLIVSGSNDDASAMPLMDFDDCCHIIIVVAFHCRCDLNISIIIITIINNNINIAIFLTINRDVHHKSMNPFIQLSSRQSKQFSPLQFEHIIPTIVPLALVLLSNYDRENALWMFLFRQKKTRNSKKKKN